MTKFTTTTFIFITLLFSMGVAAQKKLAVKKVVTDDIGTFYIVECKDDKFEVLWLNPIKIYEGLANGYTEEVNFYIEKYGENSFEDVSDKRSELLEKAKQIGEDICEFE